MTYSLYTYIYIYIYIYIHTHTHKILSLLSKKRDFRAFISLWIQNLICLYPYKAWFAYPLVKEKHFWEFPFPIRMQRTNLCSFLSCLSLSSVSSLSLPFFSFSLLFSSPSLSLSPSLLSLSLSLCVCLSVSQLKFRTWASGPLRRADSGCGEGTQVLEGGLFWYRVSLFLCCRVLGSVLSDFTVVPLAGLFSQLFSRISQNKIKQSIFYKCIFLLCSDISL